MKKVPLIIIFCLLILVHFSSQAQAVVHNFYNDPRDGVCIFYATTTTNSVTVTIGDYNAGSYYNYAYLGVARWDEGGWYYASILGTGSGYESSYRRWASKTIMTGLTPGTSYTMYHLTPAETNFHFGGCPQNYFTVITEPNKPTNPTFSNITKNSVTINWTANGNGSATKYRLYRGTSAAGPWTVVYDGPGLYHSDTGLSSDTTYYYLLSSYVSGSTEKTVDVANITTATDPAISAALAAKTASETAMIAAVEAKTGTDNVLSRLDDLEAKLNFAAADTEKPVITDFSYSVYKATVVLGSNAEFHVSARDNRSASLQYRYKVNGSEYTQWAPLGSTVNINLGSRGYKTIVLEVKDESDNIASVTKGIFRL